MLVHPIKQDILNLLSDFKEQTVKERVFFADINSYSNPVLHRISSYLFIVLIKIT